MPIYWLRLPKKSILSKPGQEAVKLPQNLWEQLSRFTLEINLSMFLFQKAWLVTGLENLLQPAPSVVMEPWLSVPWTKPNMEKQIIAKASFVRMSPRKLRLVSDAVKPLSIDLAIAQLKILRKRAGSVILKVIQQAVGNAKNNLKLSPADLKIKSILVGEGPRYKRSDRHSHGARFDSGIRHKRNSHITVILENKNGTQS